jgi:hypothetical protein
MGRGTSEYMCPVSVGETPSAMLGVLLLPPQQRSGGNRHEYKAGGTKRVRADHVGGHSNVVARDQPKQQRGRHRGGLRVFALWCRE